MAYLAVICGSNKRFDAPDRILPRASARRAMLRRQVVATARSLNGGTDRAASVAPQEQDVDVVASNPRRHPADTDTFIAQRTAVSEDP